MKTSDRRHPLAGFVFAASPVIGTGHAMRCLALADTLAGLGWRCFLIIDDQTTGTVPAISRSRHAIRHDAAAYGRLDLAVVDDYTKAEAFEQTLGSYAAAILVIDDLADRRHDADWLLDQTYGRHAKDYVDLVPGRCHVMAGSDFTLLRAQFQRDRARSIARRCGTDAVQRVVISMGGGDAADLTLMALQAATEVLPEAVIDVVVGAACSDLTTLEDYADQFRGKVTVHRDVPDMAALQSRADLAIGAAGVSALERCALGLPSLMVVAADNQRLAAKNLMEAGAAIVCDADVSAIAVALQALAQDGSRRAAMSASAASLCDGRGSQRVALAMVEGRKAPGGAFIRLRLAESADTETMLAWQRHPFTRRYARNPGLPGTAEHRAWMQEKLSDPDCFFCVIEYNDTPAGVVRLDRTAPWPELTFEVSIFTAPDHYRKGIAGAALSMVAELASGAELIAEVKADNAVSHGLFTRAGYSQAPDGVYHYVRYRE